ncbi:zinc-ribbon domain-containing protein [Desulfonauticus submarinus]
MIITCPKCEFSRDVPDEKIPKTATRATCPKCGHKFEFRKLDNLKDKRETKENIEQDVIKKEKENLWERLEDLGDKAEEEIKDCKQNGLLSEESKMQPDSIPWENLDKYGFFPGFFLTLKKVMFSPVDFFSNMEFKGYGKPLVFYLLLAEIQAVFVFLWQMMLGSAIIQQQEEALVGMLGYSTFGSLFILIFYPIMLSIFLFVGASINHFLLLIFRAGNSGFEGTYRAIAYASAPMILSIIPVIGQFIGGIWTFVVTFMAYKHVHKTTYGRVFMALVVTPIVLVLGVIFFLNQMKF